MSKSMLQLYMHISYIHKRIRYNSHNATTFYILPQTLL